MSTYDKLDEKSQQIQSILDESKEASAKQIKSIDKSNQEYDTGESIA